jgi:WD40 repeat protein
VKFKDPCLLGISGDSSRIVVQDSGSPDLMMLSMKGDVLETIRTGGVERISRTFRSLLVDDSSSGKENWTVASLSGDAVTPRYNIGEPGWAAEFSGDDRYFAYGSNKHTGREFVKVMDMKSGKYMKSFQAATSTPALAFSPDGKLLAFTSGADEVTFVSSKDWKEAKKLPRSAKDIVFSRNGALVAISNMSGVVAVYTVPGFEKVAQKEYSASEADPKSGTITDIAFSPNGSMLAVWFLNNYVKFIALK